MSTVKTKKVQIGTDSTASNNFTMYQPATPDGTLRIGVGNADSPTEVGRFDSNGYVATNAPAFSVYKSSTSSVSARTWTKCTFQTKDFDLTNAYDNTTNHRFQPNIAGYYHIMAKVQPNDSYTAGIIASYKNGSVYKYGDYNDNTTANATGTLSHLIYLNGSTDYVEIYFQFYTAQANGASANSAFTYFQGYLARAV